MQERGGAILNVVSVGGLQPSPFIGMYNVSKAALIHLTAQLALELAPDVRVNVINPGPANTPMLGGFGFDGDVAQALPLRRLVEPEDVADAAVYLATATAVTGAVFNIDAGRDL